MGPERTFATTLEASGEARTDSSGACRVIATAYDATPVRPPAQETTMRKFGLISILCVFAAASALAQEAAKPAAPQRPKAPAGATVFFSAPADGATVGQDVKV